ncbi:SAV_2336 N-terminal domain-related protein [Calothrix sp. CCY 0018]|uniref:SAV_2336 N-terminal domain-related protein n=1 Tax=Calothrix sp. CCY 0018 TaxID=3103864 RepID=UPI0039C72B9A
MTNESSATNNQFNQLIAALGTDLELTGEEIADIIWFSQKRQEISNIQNDIIPQQGNQSNTSEKLNPTSTKTPKKSNPTSTNKQTSPKPASAEISSQTEEKLQTSSKNQALPLRIPDAPSLREPLTLAQVLKPLMRRVESGRKTVLDETATVEHTAATKICIPILKSEPEPWLDVALVVDESKSMLIWRHTIWELKRLLEHYGVFRDVRAWGLVTDEDGEIYIRPGIGQNASQQRLASHREILDPNRRRLILLVSDCVGAMWRNGAITQVLKDWTNTQPMAIIQMLPDWLWLKTGLGLGASVNLASLTPGVANKHLLIKKLLLWKDINLDTGIKIPVFTLEPDTALPWSQMLTGKSDAVASGFVLSSAISQKPNRSNQPQTTTPQKVNASERVHRFRMTASPMGRKLAGLLSAAPVINLPVVRLIQETIIPASRQVHVAEVFLGGLLKPLTPIAADTLPDTVQYDFMDDQIRGMLLESSPVKDSADIFNAVSQYVAAQLGKSLQDFVALLKAPGEADNQQVKPFAEVAVKILKRLGGDYAAFAEQLEQNFQTTKENDLVSAEQLEQKSQTNTEHLELLKGFPSLQTFDFRIAAISLEEETKTPADINLQPFEYEVATIELKKSGTSRKNTELIINRRRQQSQYFTEDLGNGIELEMVKIPGGTFTMGAPKDEEGSRDSERPQHQVTVPSFFMGKYPITQAQWRVVANMQHLRVNRDLEPEPSRFKGDNLPVERVSWYDAVEFCDRLNRIVEDNLSQDTVKQYRLPSEAEWEYACRAGTTTPFHFGETITSDLANYRASSTYGADSKGIYREKTTPVGSFDAANAFGLYDMHGNVWEWCLDDLHDNYEGASTDGSAGVDTENQDDNDNRYQNLRGGSWHSLPTYCRSASRVNPSRDDYYDVIGFRVVCAVGRIL